VLAVRYFAVALATACGFTPGSIVDAGTGGGRMDSSIDTALGCDSAARCLTASMLGTVSGDTGNDKLSATGYLAAWFRVRVTEDDNGVGGASMRVAAKLTSPPGVSFDVFAYVNESSDMLDCQTSVGKISTNGAVEELRIEWGEGGIANGDIDSRNVSIEVRPASASCSAAQMWMLEVEGN
jgi:hypothetical protein